MARIRSRTRRSAVLVAFALVVGTIAVATVAAPAGATTPVGPFVVDVTNREAVRRFYLEVHEASNGVEPGWTGNVAQCQAGTVSADYLEATLTRINWFRAMSGVRSDVVFTAENNAKAQAAALIQSAAGALSHDPPRTSRCWTQLGADGSSANLTLGNTGPPSIDQLMRDGGAAAPEVGHRRNMMNPQNLRMGSGSIPSGPTWSASEAQYMEGNPSPVREPMRDGFVAWPAPGFAPYQTTWAKWSFVRPGADFANATVTMSRGGTPVASSIISRIDWAGPGLVWLADGLTRDASWPRPANDDRITVTVANVVVDGAPQMFTYDVTVFDPAVADPARTPLVVSGPDAPAIGAPATYTANAVPNATGYQWRTTRLTPAPAADGAEAGLAGFDAVVDAYDPVATNLSASGTKSFRLTIGQDQRAPASGTETLTMKRFVVPTADGQLTFKARAQRLANVTATVQASVDGGEWTTIFTERSTDDAAFGDRSVPLGRFAGRLVQLRFRVVPAGTGNWGCCGSEGWYLDDIGFTNTFEGVATVADIRPDPTLTVTPADGATLDIAVRAQSFGPVFGDWSATKRVTPPAPVAPPTTAPPVTAPPVTAPPVTAPPVTAPPPVGPILLATALENFGINWSTAGDQPWTGQAATTHDGVDAARSGTITDSQRSTLVGANVTGPAIVSFWWKVDSEPTFDFLTVELDGTEPFAGISGSVDWQQRTIDVPAGAHRLQFHYSKDGSVAVGQDAGWVDQVTLTAVAAPPAGPPTAPPVAADALAQAVDVTGRALTTSGGAPWASQTAVTHDGVDAARSGAVVDNGVSRLETTVTGPATVSFWWKVESEATFDFLTVEVDGVAPFAGISGPVDWQQRTVTVGAGAHVVRWSYTKDESVSVGADAGFVDQVAIT